MGKKRSGNWRAVQQAFWERVRDQDTEDRVRRRMACRRRNPFLRDDLIALGYDPDLLARWARPEEMLDA